MTKEEIKELDTDEKIANHNYNIQKKYINKSDAMFLVYKKNGCLYHRNKIDETFKPRCLECKDKVVLYIDNNHIHNIYSPWIVFKVTTKAAHLEGTRIRIGLP
jgi:hypothetical protein